MFNEFWSVLEKVTGSELKARSEIENRYSTAKEKLLKLLGGAVYEEKVEIEPTEEDIEEIKNGFLSHFSEEVAAMFRNFLDQLSVEELRTGKLTAAKFGFCTGTKLGKVFLKYAKDSGLLEKIGQNEQQLNSVFSILLQSIRADKFIFRLSVHPLDFLLISENTTGWKSCHSLSGARRSGNLSYLLDSATIVSYVYKDFAEFNGIKWPKKIWRQLIFVDLENAVALFQRQYPNRNDAFAENVRKILEKLLAKYLNVENPKWLLLRNPIGDIELCSPLPYVDQPEARIRLDGFSQPNPIKVGARVPCPNCGTNYVTDPKNFLCDECFENDVVQCAHCGDIFNVDDVFWYDDQAFCENCFYENFGYCEHCENTFPVDQLVRAPNGSFYCEWCFRELFSQCDNCDEYVENDELWDGPDGFYYCERCFHSLFSSCDICDEYTANPDLIEYCGMHICPECFRKLFVIGVAQCSNCGGTVEYNELIELGDGRMLCANCAERFGIRFPEVIA
jgi:hypothetical protein